MPQSTVAGRLKNANGCFASTLHLPAVPWPKLCQSTAASLKIGLNLQIAPSAKSPIAWARDQFRTGIAKCGEIA
ncbi:hypothetical protein Brsp05_03612 [Brucella sp. NBRC 12953]|uniref:hypothetical protein n=1 Tax=Brucella sp. NBRC 12953 TaxID=3075481 RepID=UPI0030A54CC1